MKLIRITYISASKLPREHARELLADLVDTSLIRNRQYEITGTLIYTGEHFAQLIEGSDEDVLRLMQNISIDKRHEDCSILMNEPIKARSVTDWMLRYSGTSTFFSDILSKSFDERNVNKSNATVLLHQLLSELAMPYA